MSGPEGPESFLSLSCLASLAGCLLYTDSPLSSQSTQEPALGIITAGGATSRERFGLIGYAAGGRTQEEFEV